ncbi:HAD family phosphatase [Actinopolymorpha sp. B17G11]|uniref:HAD family hydrolase n=1 Tax=Actinopolymorpha sp. B17G11 TaxID=3160861 RepID=UPI0032E423C5
MFDFGNVICRFDYLIFCARLAERVGWSTEEIHATVHEGGLQADFESGRLTGPEYHRRVMDLVGARGADVGSGAGKNDAAGRHVAYDEFVPMYGDIFTEIPGTVALLRQLTTRYPLYLLSDTNEIHFGFVRKTMDVVGIFDELILSYEMGVMKPHPRIYAEALRRSGVPADACVFIDDRLPNVEGARQVGIQSIHFRSPDQCATDLRQLGVKVS